MNLLEQIAYHLQLCGVGKVATAEEDGDIHWGRMPDQPDDCICVFSSDSSVPGLNSRARIQIMNRSKNVRRAYETAVQIAEEFDDFAGFLAGDGAYVHTEIINAATGLGADEKKREIYVTNITLQYCG